MPHRADKKIERLMRKKRLRCLQILTEILAKMYGIR